MIKNQKGFGLTESIIILFIVGILGTSGWLVYNRQQDAKLNKINQPSNSTQSDGYPDSKSKESTQLPRTPLELIVIPTSTGNKLTWNSTTSNAAISKYLVFYQDKKIAETNSGEYIHNLPPPPPGCTPLSLTYYIQAINGTGKVSETSNSVTVTYGGCGT